VVRASVAGVQDDVHLDPEARQRRPDRGSRRLPMEHESSAPWRFVDSGPAQHPRHAQR